MDRARGAQRVDRDDARLRPAARFAGYPHGGAAVAGARARHGARPRAGPAPARKRYPAVLRVDKEPPQERLRYRSLFPLRGLALQRPVEPAAQRPGGEPEQGGSAAGGRGPGAVPVLDTRMVGAGLSLRPRPQKSVRRRSPKRAARGALRPGRKRHARGRFRGADGPADGIEARPAARGVATISSLNELPSYSSRGRQRDCGSG